MSDDEEPTALFIEPPDMDGNVSGVDDGEEEEEGTPDNVCPSQLKAGCEIVMSSGRRIETLEDTISNGTSDYDSEDDRILADILVEENASRVASTSNVQVFFFINDPDVNIFIIYFRYIRVHFHHQATLRTRILLNQ